MSVPARVGSPARPTAAPALRSVPPVNSGDAPGGAGCAAVAASGAGAAGGRPPSPVTPAVLAARAREEGPPPAPAAAPHPAGDAEPGRTVRLGGRTVEFGRAYAHVQSFFDEAGNRALAAAGGKPSAYPAYDRYASGSGPDELTDSDFLAPLLLNARPTIGTFYSLQAARPALEAALSATPRDLTLTDAVREGSHRELLGGLVAVLDRPEHAATLQLTTLTKVLHRKRPHLVPLFDSNIRRCYLSTGEAPGYPMARDTRTDDPAFYPALAEHIAGDLTAQPHLWQGLRTAAPDDVSMLRLFDVVAWHRGRKT